MRSPAIILLSGGLDSATALAVAVRDGFVCSPLVVDYGQRQAVEVAAARTIAAHFELTPRVIELRALGELAASSLTTSDPVPKDRTLAEIGDDVPPTYVPARNTVLLGLALAYAETVGAHDIFVGFNVLDASGYPDCRREFVRAFELLADVATRSGGFRIHAPLIELTKAEIIRLGSDLGVPYELTHSCYDPIDVFACGRCDTCALRRKGFAEAGVSDPTRYA